MCGPKKHKSVCVFGRRGVAHSLPCGADDIMSAILPESEQDDLPTGFSIVGHIGALPFFPHFIFHQEKNPHTSENRQD